MIKNQKGSSIIALVVLLFVFIAGLLGFIWFYKMKDSNTTDKMTSTKNEVGSVTLDSTKKETTTYTPIEEKSSTPVEVNNEVVDELDTLMKDIDNTSNEDVSDLNL